MGIFSLFSICQSHFVSVTCFSLASLSSCHQETHLFLETLSGSFNHHGIMNSEKSLNVFVPPVYKI